MDFDAAIRSHSDWKMKLKIYIQNPDSSLDENTVCQNNLCDLGKWLESEKISKSNDAEFMALYVAHTNFHKACGDVIRKCNQKQDVSEEIAIGSQSPFSIYSTEVVSILMKMKHNK